MSDLPPLPVLPQLLYQLPRQHLGVRVRECGAEVIRFLEATGDLRLGVLEVVILATT